MRTSTPTVARRRPATLALLTSLAVASGIGLTVVLSAPVGHEDPDTARSLTAPEARRLASMRVTNHRDGGTGIRATLGRSADRVDLAGWLDWRQGLAYLTVQGPGAGADRGLVQAMPGVLVRRPPPTSEPSATSEHSASNEPSASNDLPPTVDAPPGVPPRDGWRVRPADPATRPLDAFLALLFGLVADRPDEAETVARGPSRWVGRERVGPVDVDVLAVPVAVAPPAPTDDQARRPPPGGGGQLAVRYWLDERARLHRLATTLPGDVPVVADLDRVARPSLIAVDALGGGPVTPRAVTDEEAERLARMRSVNRARGGARVTLRLSTWPAVNLRGGGWLDWRAGVAYLAIRDVDGPTTVLVRADRRGIASRPAAGTATETPVGSAQGHTAGATPGRTTTPGHSAGATPDRTADTTTDHTTTPDRVANAIPVPGRWANAVPNGMANVVPARAGGVTAGPTTEGTGSPTAGRSPDRTSVATPDRAAGLTPDPPATATADRTTRPDPGTMAPDLPADGPDTDPVPPLPPPVDRRWALDGWDRHGIDGGAMDLDLLISEGLAAGRRTTDATREVRSAGVWLRSDTLDGRPVTVFEMPKAAEAGVPPGHARLRYWVDGSGLLRRLELRTRTGAFAQLDLTPERVPYLAPVPVR
ncbi:hypothetical protein [Plantactinospora sp. GCM10030261]|uniref:hypothetical protein n=1 Tax=Plantactinospora sp. GCM10030261 TaxID=3273420 RepID=UPI0036241256